MSLLSTLACLTLTATTTGPLLTLEQALATARERQPSLHQAQAEVAAADARARQALATLLPQVSANAQYSRTTANFAGRPGSVPSNLGTAAQSASFDTFSYFNFGLGVNQLIYDFGSWDKKAAVERLADASRSSHAATAVQVALAVRTAYFEARAARALVRVAEETVANQSRHLEQARAFVEVGTRPEIDLAQARTDLANAQVQRINALNGYATAKAVLNQAMGINGVADFDVADESMAPVEGEALDGDALLAIALEARPELAALSAQLEAQARSTDGIRGAYWPRLSASTSFSEAGTALNAMAWNWDIGLALSWALFEGGRTRAQVAEADANLAAQRAQLDALKLDVRVEVERARLGVLAAKAALEAAADATDAARARLRLAEGRYETGVGNIIELSDAQVALTTAEAQAIQAEYNLATARATLMKALGRA